jgi:predicted Fe-Mo cluster-binding NifX family protein
MKIAITSQGNTLADPVEERFGRCQWILIVDLETRGVVALNNKIQRDAVQGAGIQTAENILREDVHCVITGHCGPKAFRVLQSAGVKVYLGAAGSGEKVLDEYQQGKLKLAETSDVEGHWV